MSDLKIAAKNVINNCLAVKNDESVLIIIDENTRNIGAALWEEAKNVGAEALIVKMIPRQVNGEEPPKAIAEAMKNVNVVIAPTTKSISHTKARRDAMEAGARIATMPGITEDMMIRTLGVDYNEISERSMKISDKLKGVKNIRLITPLGTDITMNFEGREFEPDTGIIRGSDFGNLPAGEVYTGPLEGTSNGVVYIDGVMAGVGMLDSERIKITVENGYATKIEGGEQAQKLTAMLDEVGPEAYNIAELGIGTNHMAKLTGKVLEDEKVMGTVHIALGNNASYGGKVNVPIHLDGIIKNPTLIADGEVIMVNGELKI